MLSWTPLVNYAARPTLAWSAVVDVKYGARTITVALRIVKRDDRFDVDMRAVGPWEQIENYRSPPRTLDDAKAYAARWLFAAIAQETLHPQVAS